MISHNDEHIDKRFSQLLSAADRNATSPDEAFLNRLREETTKTFMAASDKPVQSRRYKIMHSRITKIGLGFAAAAAITIVIGVGVVTITTTKPAYALEQTIEAITNVRFMHIVNDRDERWIEIGPDGKQSRYRQDTHGHLLVVDNRETIFAWYKDKNTVVITDLNGTDYQWIGDLGQFFKDLANDEGNVTIKENVDYKGRSAHLIRWLKLNIDAYINPDTKLPIAIDGYDVFYDDPPEGIFEIPTIPKGVKLVDKRPSAEPTEDPKWMQRDKDARKSFNQGRQALSEGNYAKAVRLFRYVVHTSPSNWAWFWLGKAYYELGEHQKAIEAYTEVFKISGLDAYECHLARGLAYKQLGMEDEAKQDFGVALPLMIDALRHTQGGFAFDYADDPTRQKCLGLSDEQRLINMINRLREVTSQNFGFDPADSAEQKEAAIAAWENWWKEKAADYGAVRK